MARTEQTLFDWELEESQKCRWCGAISHLDAWGCMGAEPDMQFCPHCGKEDFPLSWDETKRDFANPEQNPSGWVIYGLLKRGECGCVNGEKPKKRRRPQSLPGREGT